MVVSQQCNKEKVNMMADQTPLTISLMILWALCQIQVDILESMDASDEMDHKFKYANYFFGAFKGICTRKRDVPFIYELAPSRTWMILDKNLNKETLIVQESK
jgi:hypothetical protein